MFSKFVSVLGVAGFENTTFKAYPNPTTGFITISLKNNADTIDAVIVTDILGKTVQTKTIHSPTAEMDLSNLSKGIYFVKVKSEGQEKVMKVIRE